MIQVSSPTRKFESCLPLQDIPLQWRSESLQPQSSSTTVVLDSNPAFISDVADLHFCQLCGKEHTNTLLAAIMCLDTWLGAAGEFRGELETLGTAGPVSILGAAWTDPFSCLLLDTGPKTQALRVHCAKCPEMVLLV